MLGTNASTHSLTKGAGKGGRVGDVGGGSLAATICAQLGGQRSPQNFTLLHCTHTHSRQILVHSTQCSVHTEHSLCGCVCSTYHLPRLARILISNMQICSAFDCWWHICYSCLPICLPPFPPPPPDTLLLPFFYTFLHVYFRTASVCVCVCVTCLFACRLLSFASLGSKRLSAGGCRGVGRGIERGVEKGGVKTEGSRQPAASFICTLWLMDFLVCTLRLHTAYA